MTLHLYNPSHEEALAANYPHYYPSTAARRQAAAGAALPVLWAERGDAVWAEGDIKPEEAEEAARRGIRLLRRRELTPVFWEAVERIEPWGWDLLVRQQLLKAGAPPRLLPDDSHLAALRSLSSRATAVRLLPLMRRTLEARGVPTAGESFLATSLEEAERWTAQHGGAAAKSLWSCSGRGVFRLRPALTPHDRGRLKRLIGRDGAVEMEPWYGGDTPIYIKEGADGGAARIPFSKKQDFALELEVLPGGRVRPLGFSLFATHGGGGYAGNLALPQDEVRTWLQRALPLPGWPDETARTACLTLPALLGNSYAGPLGIDMMLVETPGGTALHPCIEVNLRRTMGHVALKRAEIGLKGGEPLFSAPINNP